MDNSKRKVLGSVLGIIIFIICILSLSYAWYRWRSANTDVDIGIHEGGLKFVYSNNNILESSTLSPILDYKDESYYENNNGSLIYADYTTTNTTNDTYKMIIKLNITSISDVLKNSTFKWALLEKNGSSYSKVVEEGDFSSVVVGGNILNEGIYVPPSSPTGSTSTDYRFVIYIDGNMENSSGMMNSTIKADLELCDEKVPIFNVNLNNQGATSGKEGTSKIYEKYGVGIYKDSTANTTLMTTTSNPITVPSKTGYTFNGYYTSTSCGGDQLLNNQGYITSKFTSTYTNKDMTLYACWKDTTAPTLTLTRTGTVDGFKGWTLTSGASVDSSQILTLASTSAKGTSPFYQVDEQKYEWSYDAYTTAAASEHTPNGGSYTGTNYYDSSFAAKVGSNGYSGNGQTSSIPLNTWKSVKASNYNYGTGIEYFKINMRMSSSWSMPTTKYRNFKVMGDIYAKSKYTINVSSSDSGSGIKVKKYASGSQTASYFKSSGTTFTGNSFNVTANGTYTVYIEDNSGNTTVKTIAINKIDNAIPNISSFTASSDYAQTSTISATATDSLAGIVSYAFTSSNTEPTSWTTINTKKSAYTVTDTVSSNGTYYVWFMDSASNIASKSVNVTKVDKTKPVCTIATPASVVYGSTTTVAVSCTDNASMPSQTLSTSSFTTSNNTVAQITAVSAPTAITNGYKYILTVKGVGVGSYNISMNAGVIRDSAGNTNNKVTSGNGSVTAKNISSTTITLSPTTYVYDGKAKTPTVTVKDGSTTLTKDTHYTVSYSNNTNVGTATVTITGKGNYTGSVNKTFTITKANSSISLTAKTATYTGSAIAANTATVTGTTGAVTYTYYTNSTCTTRTPTSTGASSTGGAPIDAGSYYVKATAAASSNYNSVTSSCVAHTINKKSVAVTWGSTTTFTYNGSARAPTVTTPVTGVGSEKLNLTRTTATAVGTHTSTASCSSVTGGRAKCTNYTLTGNTKSFTISYKTFNITLDDNGATSAGTSKLYVRYAEGIYLDSGYTKKMTTTTNPITIPTWAGHTFDGYYDGSTKMIDSTGKITSNFTTTKYSAAKTLTAKWTINSYTVTYNYSTNGGTSATKTTDTVEVGDSIDLTPTATKSGYTFVGWNTSSTATSGLTSLTMGTSNVTLYAIFKKTVTGTFYYYNSGIKNTTASCTMYNKATTCSITVPTSTFSSTTSQYGASYVGYGAVNTMGTSTATSATISANTSYYVSYRKSVTEYYQNKSRTVYRNAFFTSSSAMSTVLSTSTTGITNLSGASYTANSISWSWYGYATSSSATSRTYSSVAAAAKSTTTTLYTMYSRSVSATFYYYNGSSQATTTASGTQLANYKASVVSNGNITVPTTVTNSSGPSSTGTNCSGTTTTNTSSYYGVSSSVSSTTTTTPKTNVTKYYAIYKSSFSAYYNKGVGINTIGSTTNSCTNYKTTNGTTYSSSNCNVTLPAITALDGYVSQGWFKGTTTSISSTTGLSPSTSVNLTTNACYTARSRYLRADELIYDNTLTGEDCDTAQCMIDRINELIDGPKAAGYIKNLYNDGSSINTVNIGGDTSNPEVKLNATQGIMLDNNGDYRYYGANPNNYVTFNGETWRIIGAFNNVDDGTGNKETRLKIIRNESIGNYSYDSSASTVNNEYGVNDWSKADLMTELNTLYYNSTSGTCYNGRNNASTTCDFTSTGLDSTARGMIDNAVYHLGGSSSYSGLYADDYYNAERGTTVYSCSTDDGACPRATTWTGKIGLMYPSDYAYAVDLSLCTKDGYNYDNSTCKSNDWLLYSGTQWTIMPASSDAYYAFYVPSAGYAYYDRVFVTRAARPVLYLKSDVTIVGGEGTSSNPYQLG